MNHANRHPLPVTLLVTLLAGCPAKDRSPASSAPETRHEHEDKHEDDKHGHAEREHGHDDEHGHGHQALQFDPGLLDRIRAQRCEHTKKVLDCNDCRYEVGAVQVPASMMKGKDALIRTAKATSTETSGQLRLTGEIAFDERKVVHVSPLVAGVARRVLVTLGDRVRSGQLLAEIDSRELGQLRSRLLATQARVTLAKTEYEREQRLFNEKISSGKERSKAEADYKRAQIELRSLRDQLRLLGLSDRHLRGRVGRMAIRSPRNGTVVAKHVVPGENVTPSKEILTVADLDTVWVWASVFERDLAGLLKASSGGKLKARVQVAAFTGTRFDGVVDYIGATMDEATRTVKVRVSVGNQRRMLRPGMFAQLSLDLGKGRRMLQVPAKAVLQDGDERFVFVKIGRHRFLRRQVNAGAVRSGWVAINSGLREGETIVVQGGFLLKSDVLREKMGAGCAD